MTHLEKYLTLLEVGFYEAARVYANRLRLVYGIDVQATFC